MRQIEPKKELYGDITTLDTQRRFKVPKAILEALGWTGTNAPTRLLAEIVDTGRLRLWEAAKVMPFLEETETDLREAAVENPDLGSAEQHASLRALHDRYRTVTLRPSDGRIQLPSVLSAIVDLKSKSPSLYVELGENCVEVFSPHARIKRLRQYRSETNLGTV